MKKLFVSCLLLSLAALPALVSADDAAPPSAEQTTAAAVTADGETATTDGLPQLVISEIKYDFGEVPGDGQLVTHDFIVKNEGDGILEIFNVVPG